MSLTLSQLSALEQLEAQASALLLDFKRLRVGFIPTLEEARKNKHSCREHVATCKQLVADWEKLERDYADIEDNAILQLSNVEESARISQRTLGIVRDTLSKEFPINPNSPEV